jgi:hypothetical protein
MTGSARRHRHLAPDTITADEVEQLAAAFTARLRREIADARDLLGDVLDAPLPRPHAADLPLIWRDASGELTPTLPEHDDAARPLSARELLDLLADRAATFAEREAETLALALVKLARDDDERQDWRARAPSVWPWSTWLGFYGDDLLPSIVGAVETAARAKRGDPAPPPASDDAHEWASDTLERRREGYAQEIRAARAAGFSGLSLPGAVLAPRQLAALYGLLPATVRAARETRRYVERVARGDEQRALLEQIAPEVLKRARADVTDANRSTLAESTRRHVAAWRSTLPLDTPLPTTEAEAARELDALAESLAVHAATMGEQGARAAAVIQRENAENRLDFWQVDAQWLVTFAVPVWLDRAAQETTKRPALVMPVHEAVTMIHSRAAALEERNGQRALRFDHADPFVMTMRDDVAEIIAKGVDLLGSVTAHRLLRWEILSGHERALDGAADPRVLVVDGGWSVLAHDILGMKAKTAPADLRAIVHAQQAIRVPTPDGTVHAGLVTFSDTPARGHQKGRVAITLGELLMPHIAYAMKDPRDRRLVPVLRELPPMVGRKREHGAIATLSMAIMRELRVHACDLASVGSVAISRERFHELARQARVPLDVVTQLLERWLRDGDDGHAFLASPSAGRYTLGPAHAHERDFLVMAGRMSAGAARGGRRTVANRHRKLLGRK